MSVAICSIQILVIELLEVTKLVSVTNSQYCFFTDFTEPIDLCFPPNSDGYAITEDSAIPDMMSFSVCFWVKLIFTSGQTATLLSYSTSVYEKAFVLDTQGITLDIYMDDAPYL